ncbi:MAG: hypothetical protein V9G13_01650 [Marmoricola sp.]
MSFRGASADAFAALSDKLGAVDAASVAAVADDLFKLATVLREEPSLRRVATDVSTEAAAKQGLGPRASSTARSAQTHLISWLKPLGGAGLVPAIWPTPWSNLA